MFPIFVRGVTSVSSSSSENCRRCSDIKSVSNILVVRGVTIFSVYVIMQDGLRLKLSNFSLRYHGRVVGCYYRYYCI